MVSPNAVLVLVCWVRTLSGFASREAYGMLGAFKKLSQFVLGKVRKIPSDRCIGEHTTFAGIEKKYDTLTCGPFEFREEPLDGNTRELKVIEACIDACDEVLRVLRKAVACVVNVQSVLLCEPDENLADPRLDRGFRCGHIN